MAFCDMREEIMSQTAILQSFALVSDLTPEGRELLGRYISTLPDGLVPVPDEDLTTVDDSHLFMPNLHTIDWQRRLVGSPEYMGFPEFG
jgi:hypothetical protein